MGRFSRSWQIAKLSFDVIGKDKEMLAFPILSGLFSMLYVLTLLFPTIIVGFIGQESGATLMMGVVEYALLFLSYLGISFIATFFNTCVVYTTKVRFEGGDATFMDSLKFAFSKIGLIFSWSMVAATVGLLLRALDHLAERMGGIGQIVLKIFRSMLGMIWSIVTIFVVPAMVYENLGPKEAIQKSAKTIKETWGESLIRHYGLGFVSGILVVAGVVMSVVLVMVFGSLSPAAAVIGMSISALYFLAIFVVFNCANTVFNTALYVYANHGKGPEGFDSELLQGVFSPR